MGTFELSSPKVGAGSQGTKNENDLIVEGVGERHKEREECIIALKVYDSCRQQQCLTAEDLEPAKAAECVFIDHEEFQEGEIIKAPHDAAVVTIDKARVKKVVITDKRPCQFKPGFWDVVLKYVFEYDLVFRNEEGFPIEPFPIKAMSTYCKTVTLFGAVGANITISTDLFNCMTNDATILDFEPFVLAEAKAVSLNAEIECEIPGERGVVFVTLGMFTVIKLFRIAPLSIDTKGCCIPDECEDVNPISPCEHFASLEFPVEFFAPPQGA